MFVGLQYLRAYAALLVLFFHAAIGGMSPVRFGEAGVDVFFVLSGFLMWKVTKETTQALGFMKARAKRIVPIYWIATFAVFGAALLGLTGRISPDPLHLIASLAFIPYEDARGMYPLLNVGWTLNYEMFFYVVFALALWSLPRRIIPLFMTSVFVALSALGPMLSEPILAFYTDPIILEFVAGIWLAVLIDRTPGRLAGAALLLLGVIGTISGGGLPRVIGYGIPAVMCVWGMLAIERDGGVPSIPVLKLLGDASYSIYIWHIFVIAALTPALGGLPFGTLLLFIAGLVGGLGGYYAIEQPLLARARKGSPRTAETSGL